MHTKEHNIYTKKLNVSLEWFISRPVTREGAGGEAPPRKFFAPPGKMCWI